MDKQHNTRVHFPTRRLLPSFLIVAISLCFLSSCTTMKESAYFKTLNKDTTISGFVTNDFESKIIKGDNLSIVVTSFNKEEDALFNQTAGDLVSTGQSNAAGFLVKSDGTVLLHRLGNTKVEGMTRKELAKQLQASLLPYMKDPIVNVNYLNHKVTIMGSVKSPQVLNMFEDQQPLIDVLIKSGDLAENARRNNVMIIREENDQKIVKHVNLEDNSILTSPWYYVKPNDIVYVMADNEKIAKEERKKNVQSTVALAASVITLLVVVIDRVIN